MISNGYGSKKKEGARLRKTHEKYRQMAKIPNTTPQKKALDLALKYRRLNYQNLHEIQRMHKLLRVGVLFLQPKQRAAYAHNLSSLRVARRALNLPSLVDL